jgi:hypothetical protein
MNRLTSIVGHTGFDEIEYICQMTGRLQYQAGISPHKKFPSEADFNALIEPVRRLEFFIKERIEIARMGEDAHQALESLSRAINRYTSLVCNVLRESTHAQQFYSDRRCSNRRYFYTEHYEKSRIYDSKFLRELAALIATAPKPENQHERPTAGVIVSNYTAEYLLELFNNGMECIAYRSSDSGNDKLLGAILFYPKGKYTDTGRIVRQFIPDEHGADFSELELTILLPEAQHRLGFIVMMDEHLIHFMRLGLRGGYSLIGIGNDTSQYATEQWGGGTVHREITLEEPGLEDWLLLTYPTDVRERPEPRATRAANVRRRAAQSCRRS